MYYAIKLQALLIGFVNNECRDGLLCSEFFGVIVEDKGAA